ncbi:MFS transporter [Amycolatopsis sp. NPDC004368]
MSTEATVETHEIEVGEPSRFAVPAMLLALFVMPIGITGTAIAVPRIADELGASPSGLQWVVNGFNAAFAVFTLVWGVASDRLGHKRTFVSGSVLMVVASGLSAVAPNLPVLDLARVLAGVAGAAMFTGASAIMSNAYPPGKRARNFAFLGTTIGAGVALGPTIAGLLTEAVGWRGIFVVFGAVVVLSLFVVKVVPSGEVAETGGRKVDFSLLKNARYLAFALVPVAAAVGYVPLMTYLPIALSAIKGLDTATSGLVMLAMTAPVLVGPTIASRVLHRFPDVRPMTVIRAALLLMVAGDAGMLLLGGGASLGLIIVPMLLLGFSFGLPLGLVDGEAIGSVARANAGTAAGVLSFLRLGSEAVVIGGYSAALTVLLGRDIADTATANAVAAGAGGHAAEYAASYHVVLVVMIALSLVVGAVIVLLDRITRHG